MPASIKHDSTHVLQSHNRFCCLVTIVALMIFGVTRVDDYPNASPAQLAENWQKQLHAARSDKWAFNNYFLPSAKQIPLKRPIKRVLIK